MTEQIDTEPKEKPSKGKTKWYHVVLIIIGVLIFLTLLGNSTQNNTNTSSSSSTSSTSTDPSNWLSADIHVTSDGAEITNKESADWTDCTFGVNAPSGWNFNNPPYKTQNSFSVPANGTKFIPYSLVTTSDGEVFDSTTHTVNTAVLECFQDTHPRYFSGNAAN